MKLEIEELEIIEWHSDHIWNELISRAQGQKSYYFKDKHFTFEVIIEPRANNYYFESCYFEKGLSFKPALRTNDKNFTTHYDEDITLTNCKIDSTFEAKKSVFDGKVRIHDCEFQKVELTNTKFNSLADFWLTKFTKDVIFYKTDFNSTVVFSMVTFNENVLFTYSLMGAKAIFARTRFEKGLDFSQTVISGEIQPFDLHFDYEKFETEFVGGDDEKYQKYIDTLAKIPLVNKVRTFQILKKAFQDIGSFSDSILMLREEKKALRNLTKFKLKNKNNDVNLGDKWILSLNRLSNNYNSDFRNGIWFTLGSVVVFGILTLIFTDAYLDGVCFQDCEFDPERLTRGVEFFMNFFNPARGLTYLDQLNPVYGVSYFFDFLGRISVGYGIYQTVQAFRKYK